MKTHVPLGVAVGPDVYDSHAQQTRLAELFRLRFLFGLGRGAVLAGVTALRVDLVSVGLRNIDIALP